MKRKTAEEKYKENVRKQEKILKEFAEYEYEWAGDLMLWYDVKKLDIPDDVYRACAFFRNREHRNKPGSLTMLYEMYVRCNNELLSEPFPVAYFFYCASAGHIFSRIFSHIKSVYFFSSP